MHLVLGFLILLVLFAWAYISALILDDGKKAILISFGVAAMFYLIWILIRR